MTTVNHEDDSEDLVEKEKNERGDVENEESEILEKNRIDDVEDTLENPDAPQSKLFIDDDPEADTSRAATAQTVNESMKATSEDDARWTHNYLRIVRQYKEFGRIPRDAWVRRQLRIPQTEDKLQLLRSLGIRYVPGSEIRERRKGFSRCEIALKLGISGGTHAVWENGMVPEYIVWEIMDVIRKMQELYKWKNVYFVHNGVEYAGVGNGRTIIVRKETQIDPEVTETFRKTSSAALRKKLIQRGIIKDNQFTENYEFASPAKAASVLSGCAISSRNTWHDQAGMNWYAIWPELAWKV